VWLAAERAAEAHLSWRTGDGRHRNIGTAPIGADLIEPTVEDGYLLLVGRSAFDEEAA
jgi:ABC-2 type transport system ATP-binding protein